MNESTPISAIPFAVTRKMRMVRQRKIWVQIASATVAAAAVLLLAMAIAMLIDWLATLYDVRWRAVLTTAAIAAAVVTISGWLVMAWRRGLRWERVALDVDRQLPQLEERWTTMARLGPEAANPQVVHPAMLRRVATEAAGWEPHVDPQQVVSLSALGKALVGLSAITAALIVAVLFDSHRTMVLMRRFWLPGASISATELEAKPGNLVVGKGEPVELTAAIKGSPVDKALLFLQSGANPEETITLVAHGEGPVEFSHRIRAVEDPFEYRIRAGDGQTEWFKVDVTDRPEIEALLLGVTPPAYTGRPTASFDKLPRRLTAMEQSELQLAIRPTVAVKSLQLKMGDDQLVDMTADADGWYRWKTTLKESFSLSPILTEEHGLTNRRISKLQINVLPDKAPVVKVISPDDQVAVRPNDTIKIDFVAQDDVGIGKADLVVYDQTDDGPVELATIPIPLDDQIGARRVEGTVNLDLSKYEIADGKTIVYEVRVSESRDGAVNAAANQQQEQRGPRAGRGRNQNAMANTTPRRGDPAKAVDPSTTKATAPQTDTTASATQPTTPSDTVATNDSKNGATNPAASNQDPSKSGPSTTSTTSNQDPSKASPSPTSTASNQSTAKGTDGTTMKPTDGAPMKPSDGAPPMKPSDAAPSPTSVASDSAKQGNPSTSPSSPNAQDSKNANPGEPSSKAGMTPDNSAKNTVASNDSKANPSETPRTVSSERKSLNPNNADADGKNMPNPTATASNGNPMPGGENQPSDNQQASGGGKTPPPGNMANQSQPSSSGSTPPPNSMEQRTLDVGAQAASSQRMRLQVDEWAGSFDGQQRHKLEIAIAPELAALDAALVRAQETSRTVLDEIDAAGEWRGKHDRDMTNAERSTVDAQQVIRGLGQKAHNTPYAFIGLQLTDIGTAHVNPARNNFWTALQSEGEARVNNVRDGWQHVTRARQLLADLNGQFQRAQKEFELAEKLQQVKKMYQVFIEDSFQLLNGQAGDPNRYPRDMAELKMDDEYLKRLKEVLEMRRDMMAELARILAEDPRLLQRYMDLFKNRATNLREQLADLVAEQQDLNREVRAWTLVDEAERPRIAQILMQRQLNDATKLATDAGSLQDRYQTWIPLSKQAKDADLQSATKAVQATATAANELNAKAVAIVSEMQRIKVKPPAGAANPPAAGDAAAAQAPAAPEWDSNKAFTDLRATADTFNRRLTELDVILRQMGSREDDAEIAVFAANRLVEARRLIANTTAWIRQIDEHKAGNYARAAEVAQYRLAEDTDRLAGKLGDIEQTLLGLLQRRDNKLPEPIAEKAREFLTAMDKQAQPNQLAAVYALRANQMPRATERQQAAHEGLVAAEKAFDEMMRMAVTEMDKLPVQDPIAQLLQDPTLDELLAALEQEAGIEELLGISPRPTNLQIIGDWLRPGSGGGGGGGGGGGSGAGMLGNQMRQRGNRARQRIDRSYAEAIKRALKESNERKAIGQPQPAVMVNWNKLVSELGDDLQQGRDKAPPEQYRRGIEQYFKVISAAVAQKQEDQP